MIPAFSSVPQSCPTPRDPMNRSTPGLPVHHHLPEFTQTHLHRVGDAIQPSHHTKHSKDINQYFLLTQTQKSWKNISKPNTTMYKKDFIWWQSTFNSRYISLVWRRKWQPTLVFLPGESQGRGSQVGCRLWGRTESDTMKWLSSSSSSKHRRCRYLSNIVISLSSNIHQK